MKLKPCPKCKSTFISVGLSKAVSGYLAICLDCMDNRVDSEAIGKTKEEAIANWNELERP